MKLSPQSDAVVKKLSEGSTIQSGEIRIGPLDELTRAVLDVLVNNFDDISRRTGEDQARAVRGRVVTTTAAIHASKQASQRSQTTGGLPPNQDTHASDTLPANVSEPPKWKLLGLRCESIRGVAPPGELFSFEFHGESNLIYGPNGSGKSSLLSAVLWCLTGEIIADSEPDQKESPMYRVTGSSSKARSWPHVVTLPEPVGFEAASPTCWVELQLQREADKKNLWLRRMYPVMLEASWDGTTWSACNDLGEFLITPLDLQLSLTAPTVFSRRSLEEASNVRSILTLILGYDNIEELGDLASKISGNRTRLQKSEEATLRSQMDAQRALLNRLADALPESSAERQALSKLATKEASSPQDFEKVRKAVDEALSAAEQAVAQDLGLTEARSTALAGLADKVTVGLAKLEKGITVCLPSLACLQLSSVCPATEEASSEQMLRRVQSALVEYIGGARQAIARRAELWRRECAPGSKATLLLKAAQFYDPSDNVCPVCDCHIDNATLTADLTNFRTLDPQLTKDLQLFFADLAKRLKEIVPQSVRQLVEATPATRLLADWASLCKELGPALTVLTQTYEGKVTEIASAIAPKQTPEHSLLPTDVDEVFSAEAATFLRAMADSEQGLGLLDWAVGNLATVLNDLDNVITKQSSTSSRTLYMALAQGKDAAAIVKPLAAAKTELAAAIRALTDIEALRLAIERLKELADPLDKLKLLSKYAEVEVGTAFNSIREATIENTKCLYPESATGMELGHLKMGKGKDKSVEAMLSTKTYRVPGQFFANAGLQRAVALSFYFALLKRHPKGLGFLVMDDPILSLDEDHRERWSSDILCPILPSIQVVLATHQADFLKNCRQEFSADRIVHLNPRDRKQRISWQPGDRLRRAQRQLSTDHLVAAMSLRKFREDLLISLDAYSPVAFFDPHDLKGSLDAYARLASPNPLAGSAQRKIVHALQEQTVARVLDPAVHSLTEAAVTKPMVEDCLRRLLSCEIQISKEFGRLERMRKRAMRGSRIPAAIVPFARLNDRATWPKHLGIPFIGAAAARSTPWTVEIGEEGHMLWISPGAAVLVAGDVLNPVAWYGQWALLAPEEIVPNDGDLVAAEGSDGNRYLRRVWPDGEHWTLEGINPVRPVPPVSVRKMDAPLRKIVGVLYEPTGIALRRTTTISEWEESGAVDIQATVGRYHAIDVMGQSIEPLARSGQKVLVGEKCDDLDSISGATLAVLQTDGAIGNVIKRVYPKDANWILISANPVEPIDPILLPRDAIRAIWPICGVLFESNDEST